MSLAAVMISTSATGLSGKFPTLGWGPAPQPVVEQGIRYTRIYDSDQSFLADW
jgi:hypothetical protein